MAYQRQYNSKREFMRDKVSMTFGSLANLYSSSQNPPDPEEVYQKAIEFTERIWDLGNSYDEFPELDEKLYKKLMKELETNEREIGKYYASELYDYLQNYIPPEKFLEPRLPKREELMKMYFGEIIHLGIQKLFRFKEKKYEFDIGDGIKIVGKIDLELKKGEIVELKTKEDIDLYENLPLRYVYQCQAYLAMKNLYKMRLYLIGWGLSRKLFIVVRDESLWDNIVRGLKIYHQKVLEAYRKRE